MCNISGMLSGCYIDMNDDDVPCYMWTHVATNNARTKPRSKSFSAAPLITYVE